MKETSIKLARRFICAALLLASAAPASAAEAPIRLRLCVGDVDYPPYTMRSGGGRLQYLVDHAAPAARMEVEWYWMPVRRCNEEVRGGAMDATITALYPEMLPHIAYPLRDGNADETYALEGARLMLYRRAGSSLNWDGERVSGMGQGAVGVYAGFAVATGKLARLGLRFDDGAKSLEQNLDKLVRGRLEAVVALENEASVLVEKRYATKVDMLPQPFIKLDAYLVFSKAYYARDPEAAKRLWTELQRVRKSADFQRLLTN